MPSKNDSKHSEAHEGMKFVMSLERVKVAALANMAVVVHSVNNRSGLAAILYGSI